MVYVHQLTIKELTATCNIPESALPQRIEPKLPLVVPFAGVSPLWTKTLSLEIQSETSAHCLCEQKNNPSRFKYPIGSHHSCPYDGPFSTPNCTSSSVATRDDDAEAPSFLWDADLVSKSPQLHLTKSIFPLSGSLYIRTTFFSLLQVGIRVWRFVWWHSSMLCGIKWPIGY